MIYRYVSGKEILRKVFRDLRPSNADFMHDAIEWMGEALEHIGASAQLCKKTCVIPINDHKGKLPNDLYGINDASINVCVSPDRQSELNVLSAQINELNTNLSQYYSTVTSTVTSNMNGQYISNLTPEDLKEFDSYHASTLNQLNVLNSRMTVLEQTILNTGGNCMQPLAMGTSTYLPQSNCPECPQPIRSKESYYINCGIIQTTFATGNVCLSYTAFMTDEECYPMVPDNISYRDAMFWYIVMKMLLQGQPTRNPSINYEAAEMRWLHYCTQARNAAVYPDMKGYQNFLDQWTRLIPDINRDINFFENLNDREALQRDHY
jgi:hypothetical protein